jgi:hypothetical protein
MSQVSEPTFKEREREAERLRELRAAVHDLPDSDGGRITREDVEILRRAGFMALAEIAERYV